MTAIETTTPLGLIWFAVRTKPGREVAAVEGLKERRFDVYLPAATRLRRTSIGRRSVLSPLIPGYVFVGVGPDSPRIYDVVAVSAVSDVVRYANGIAAEIRSGDDGSHFVYAMRALQAAGAFDYTPRTKTFVQGQKVRITAGAWTGYIGEIIDAAPGRRAHVMLSGIFAGRSGVPIDPKFLDAAA